jgi:hypothetical protein
MGEKIDKEYLLKRIADLEEAYRFKDQGAVVQILKYEINGGWMGMCPCNDCSDYVGRYSYCPYCGKYLGNIK